MKKIHFLIGLVCLISNYTIAQFKIDGEFRPRTEYRHGYGSPIAEDADAGFGISTRARVNFGYADESYKVYLSLQDVMTWGENRQLLPADTNNSFAVFEAWGELTLGEGFSTKIGRQTLDYDDQRILGSVGWAQQARNHDAALLQYKKDKFLLDVGLAFNQDKANLSGFSSVGTEYSTTGFFSYKTMQYLYLKQNWDTFSGSLLVLNNGFQEYEDDGVTADGTSSLLTLGTHLEYKKGKLGVSSNLFLQTGKRQGEVDVKGAYLASLDFSLKTSDKITLGAGIELISGNDADAGETGAFFPLYGTNHKFNGFMDYFYVGNHANSVGLLDVHLSANFKLNETSNLMVKALNFSGEQELPSGEKSLGTEIDLVFSKKFKGYGLAIGYSQMFANDGMYELKETTKDASAGGQNWAWAMLTIKPKFLNTTK
ncbi:MULTISPECIES: alginate export family protein [unclassified Cellulophaga]|uniref:alginate export family protein n=1 Tax=unclassified Cellulophaga TaxID=2634405 RepID=UPI0026E2E110|nr:MULTISPECIES: alginate export family protein [unclassified Cellulophaga]MDO6491890.1 alginate export family protein [Cellulophaga sp. 2_MG-2023]MDO6495455.1 alginate export family protein [Cellulophaga sp. 3_MG-2023]